MWYYQIFHNIITLNSILHNLNRVFLYRKKEILHEDYNNRTIFQLKILQLNMLFI